MSVAQIKDALKRVPNAKLGGKRDELFDRLKKADASAAREPYALVKHGYNGGKEGECYAAVDRLLAASPRQYSFLLSK